MVGEAGATETERASHETFDIADGLAVGEGGGGTVAMGVGVVAGDTFAGAADWIAGGIEGGIADDGDILAEGTLGGVAGGSEIGLELIGFLGATDDAQARGVVDEFAVHIDEEAWGGEFWVTGLETVDDRACLFRGDEWGPTADGLLLVDEGLVGGEGFDGGGGGDRDDGRWRIAGEFFCLDGAGAESGGEEGEKKDGFHDREGSAGFPDADGVALGLVVEGLEPDSFLGGFGEDEILPGRFVTGTEALGVLEHALDLDLDPAFEAVADIGGDLEASVGENLFLKAGAGDGALDQIVHGDELGFVLEVELGGVPGAIGSAFMAADDRAGGAADRLGGGSASDKHGGSHDGGGDEEWELHGGGLLEFHGGAVLESWEEQRVVPGVRTGSGTVAKEEDGFARAGDDGEGDVAAEDDVAGGIEEVGDQPMFAGRNPEGGEADEVGEVVPGPGIGGGSGGGADYLAEETGDQQAGADFVCGASATGGAGEYGAGDDGGIAEGVGGTLEDGLVGKDMIHDTATAGGCLEGEIVGWGYVDGLAGYLETQGRRARSSGTESQLFAVLTGGVFGWATAHFEKHQDVGSDIIIGEGSQPCGGACASEGILTPSAEAGGDVTVEVVEESVVGLILALFGIGILDLGVSETGSGIVGFTLHPIEDPAIEIGHDPFVGFAAE